MQKSMLCFLTLSACLLARLTIAELILVENGESRMPIIIFADAPPLTRRAADELAEYIEKTSGARPEVLEGLPDPLPQSAIWVGVQPILTELFPDQDFDFQHPEEILIAANDRHLVIAGRDRWDPDTIVTLGRPGAGQIEGWQAEHGTINAVYTFLRDWLDVRWLWPGETGLDILPKERIAFDPFEYRYHPQIRMRYGVLRLSGPGDTRGYAWDGWARFQRIYFGSIQGSGGHDFGGWWNRFHERNPEYFALQPDGSRGGGERPFPSAGNIKMCQSNPGVWAQWLADVEKQIEADPNRRYFGAGIGDSHSAGHCICENCRAWDEQDASRMRLNWQGIVQEYVVLSDRDVRFGNELARLLRDRYPDRDDYRVCLLAYGPTKPPPVVAVPDEKIVVTYVGNIGTADRYCPDGTMHDAHIAGWATAGAEIVYRPNLGGFNANDLVHGQLPAVFFGKMMETFRFIADHHCVGLWFDTVREAWPTQGPLYYLMAHLAWDPYADGDAILDDYYRRGFGPAHTQLKAYWTLMEETRNARVDAGLSDSLGWRAPGAEIYNEEFFRNAEALLDEAEVALAGDPEIYLRRLEHVRAGLDFTRLMVEASGTWERYLESERQDEEAAVRLRAIWEQIMPLGRKHMIWWNQLNHHRRRMHPDVDNTNLHDWHFMDWRKPGDRGLRQFQQIP